MKFIRWVAAAAVMAALASSNETFADETADVIKQLKQQIEELAEKVRQLELNRELDAKAKQTNSPSNDELAQKVKILERNRELDKEAAEAKAKEAPKVSIGDRGLSVTSADGNFAVQLKAVLQVDSRTFFNDDISNNDGFLLRRARPGFG